METPSKVPEQVKTPSYDRTVQVWTRAYLETVSLRKKLEAEEKKMKEAEALFPEIRNIAGLARKKRLVTGDPGREGQTQLLSGRSRTKKEKAGRTSSNKRENIGKRKAALPDSKSQIGQEKDPEG